jgi:hypothetical protein
MKRWLAPIVVLAGVSHLENSSLADAIETGSQIQLAEKTYSLMNFSRHCPDLKIVEVTIGSLTIFVDPKIVHHLASFDDPAVIGSCPTTTVHASSISFYLENSRLAEVFKSRDLPLYLLKIVYSPFPDFDPAKIPTAPDKRIEIDPLGTIDDITGKWPGTVGSRPYRLQFAPAAGVGTDPFNVVCGGPLAPNNLRECRASYHLMPHVLLVYAFRLRNRVHEQTIGNMVPPGFIREPQDFLQIDLAVRDWIRALQQRP